MKITIQIILMSLFLMSANLWGQGIENILRQRSLQEIQERIQELEKENRQSAAVLYLKAAIEPDGKKALSLYEQVLLMYPKSAYADDAKLKIGQYYFMIGFYHLAAEQFRELIWQYPNSTLRDGASYYSAQCYIAMEQKEDAKRALRQFMDQFRNSGLIPMAVADLKALEGQEIAGFPPVRTTPNHPGSAKTDEAPKEQPTESGAIYSIQVGAFLKSENAERQQNYFKQHGYPAEVMTKRMDGKFLYVVTINRFSNYDAAVAFGKQLNEKYRVSFQVINLDELK